MSRRRLIITLIAVALALGVGATAWFLSAPGSTSVLGDKPRIADVAKELGCLDVQVADTTRLFARESGHCTFNGKRLSLEVFDSNDLRDQYLKMGQQFGGNYATGHHWLVFGDSPDAVATAAERLGGKVV